jgi:uncharacterized protein
MTPILAILAACVVLIATSAAIAGPIEDASAAYGRGDYAGALKILRPLADRNVGEADFELGYLYYNGTGVPQNYVEAARLYRLAAEQGVSGAQKDLGVMYMNGQGVPQNYVLAHMWLNLAGSQLPASQAKERDSVIKARDLVASKMTPAQIAEAQKMASEWKQSPQLEK